MTTAGFELKADFNPKVHGFPTATCCPPAGTKDLHSVTPSKYVSPQNSYVGMLTPKGMVLKGSFGSWLGHVLEALVYGLVCLPKWPQRAPSSLPLCENSGRKLLMNHEVGPSQTLYLPAPWPWTSQSPRLRQRNVCLKHQVHGNLL